MGNDQSSSDERRNHQYERAQYAEMYYEQPQHSNQVDYKYATTIHQFTVLDIHGQRVNLKRYKGKVCLIVNFGIWDDSAPDMVNKCNRLLKLLPNLRILAFPCNPFGADPSTNQEILDFARNHHAKFHFFSKVNVNADNAEPLFKFLKLKQSGFLGDFIKGNFTTFVIDQDGVPVERHGPFQDPLGLVEELELLCCSTNEEFEFVETSTRKPNNNRNKNVKPKEKGDFDCPTCCKRYGLQVYQCGSGHTSCKDCKLRNARCGICRQPITDMRNIALEGLLSDVRSPCPNAHQGCCLSFKLGDMEFHLSECPFSSLFCPLFKSPCFWKGKLSNLSEHFEQKHPDNMRANVNSEMFLFNICNQFSTMHYVRIGGHHFLIHLKIEESQRKIYMTVQLIGTKVSAGKWTYELHVYNKREPRRKYQFIDVCSSHSIPVEEVFQESKCAVVPLAYAMTYIHEGCLNYKIFITKNEENQNRGGGARRRQK